MKRLFALLLTVVAMTALAAPPPVSHKARPAAPHVKRSLAIAPALAGTVTLTSAPATGGTATLTWTTTASADGIAASGCTASGGWTGAQAASGSFTTAPVTVTTVFTLTCTWNDTTSTLTWTNPTTLSPGGAAFTDQTGVYIYGGTAPTGLTRVATLTGTPTSDVLTGQAVGTNYYAVSAISKADGEGTPSVTVAKANGAATAAASTTVTAVQALPSPPTNVTVQ
jgi:hypothetical protein